MRNQTISWAFLFLILCLSCQSGENNKYIVGEWEKENWYVKQTQKPIAQTMHFQFDSLGEYSIDYGSEIEKGKYWINYGQLYTQEEGQNEKNVQIVRLDSNTLILEMNRSGQIEVLELKKRQIN